MLHSELNAAHEQNLNRLIEEFGEEQEVEVRKAYQQSRETLEREASIFRYTPILTTRAVREALCKK